MDAVLRADDSPCPDCGEREPPTNSSTERCRDCDLDYLMESARCKECGLFIYADWCKVPRSGHAATCSKLRELGEAGK